MIARVLDLQLHKSLRTYQRSVVLLREYRALLARYRAAVDSQPTTHTKA